MPRSSQSFEDLVFTIHDPEELHNGPILPEHVRSRLDRVAADFLVTSLLHVQPQLYARVTFPEGTEFLPERENARISVHLPRVDTRFIVQEGFSPVMTGNILNNLKTTGLKCEWDVRVSTDGREATAFPSVDIGFDLGFDMGWPMQKLTDLLDELKLAQSVRVCVFPEPLEPFIPAELPQDLRHLLGITTPCYGTNSNVRNIREALVQLLLGTPKVAYHIPIGIADRKGVVLAPKPDGD